MKNNRKVDEVIEIAMPTEYEEEKVWAKKNVNNFLVLNRVTHILSIILLISLYMQTRGMIGEYIFVPILWAFFIITCIYSKRRKKFINELTCKVQKECSPDEGLTRYCYYLQKIRKKKINLSGIYFYVGMALVRSGQNNAAGKIIKLIDLNCKDKNSIFFRECIRSLVAEYYMDAESLHDCATTVQKLKIRIKKGSMVEKEYNRLLLNDNFAFEFENGKYEELRKELTARFNEEKILLDKVSIAYKIYLLAKKTEDTDKAEECRRYILENGGTTWYRKAVEDGFAREMKKSDFPDYGVSEEKLKASSKINPRRFIILAVYFFLAYTIAVKPFIIGYSFRKATEDEIENFGGAKICSIYSLVEYKNFPKAYGQLMTLFGDADSETEDLENQYTYFICATKKNGEKHIIMAYSGATGPAICGTEDDEKAAKELVKLIRRTKPKDYDYEGYYMDGPCKEYMGVKHGRPYMREEELNLSNEEFNELWERICGGESDG